MAKEEQDVDAIFRGTRNGSTWNPNDNQDRLDSTSSVPKFSIIIPTYHEEDYIKHLLTSIHNQTLQPEQVIVADRLSGDRTRSIAHLFGYKVVEGGIPAVGRNRGAEVATQPILIFIDADCILPNKDFLQKAISFFMKHKCDVASCFTADNIEKIGKPIPMQITINLQRILNLFTTRFFRKIIGEGGAFIICKHEVFDAIKGFNEEMKTMEDADFFQRAVTKAYKYSVIPQLIETSNRRLAHRSYFEVLKIALIATFLTITSSLGIKGLFKIKRKYDKEVGELGGHPGSRPH